MTPLELLVLVGCIVSGVGLLTIVESETVRFGPATTGTCSECHQLRQVVAWHNHKAACLPCIRKFESEAPCP